MSLSERIANLEKSNRRLKAALAFGGVIIGAFLVMGAAAKSGTKLRTEKLELVDSKGTLRAVLQVRTEPDANYTELSFFDSNGKCRRLSLVAGETFGFVEVTERKNRTEHSRRVGVD